MKGTLIQLLKETKQKYPEKAAIIHGDKVLSYQELWTRACGLSSYLVENGLQKGDRVSLLLENSPEYAIAYYGVLMAGGAAIGLNTATKARDLANWIQHSGSKVLIANPKHPELDSVKDSLLGSDILYLLVSDDADSEWHNIVDSEDIKESIVNFDSDTQLAALIYTSGTTGKPKGVMLSHQNLYENMVSILEYLKIDDSDSILNVLPFYYSYGNSVLHTHIAAGATIVLENSMLYPQKVVQNMAEKKVTGFSGVPSTYSLLLSRTRLEEFNLTSLRYLTQAGGPMAPVLINKVKKILPDVQFFVMYGQTEASARLSYLPPENLEKKSGSIGVPIPGVELEVMDASNSPVGPGVTGEIYARGKNIMLGYWDDPESTEKVFYQDWLKTGDLAYKDEDGYLYIVGRSSEMIKSGAHRISPKDIEEVILALDEVEEVAVVGVEDEILGQVIKAVIVSAPGCQADKKSIMRYCKSNLANYKLPKQIEFVDQIPRTASGKVRRFMLQ
jgi:acyl-CoA synthetase (AMP-forming)/AMP-acid ligase II